MYDVRLGNIVDYDDKDRYSDMMRSASFSMTFGLRYLPVIACYVLVLLVGVGCGGGKHHQDEAPPLVIATAANVQFAMVDLIDAFTSETGIACERVLGSSGKLTAQIKAGAPYDVFVSANMLFPETLYEEGLSENAPMVYAYGKLVMWSCQDTLRPSWEMLTLPAIEHVAIANPKTAPYGTAAMQVLESKGIYASIKDKLVYGESIAQTNQFILSGTASIGFTAMSVTLSPPMREKGHWVAVDEDRYDRIAQGVVVLKKTDDAQADTGRANQFMEFLLTEKARSILATYGYDPSPPAL